MTKEEFAANPPQVGDTVFHQGLEWKVTVVMANGVTMVNGGNWFKTVLPGDIELKPKQEEEDAAYSKTA